MIKKNSFIAGFIPGLLLPFAGAWLFYLFFFNYMEVEQFARHVWNSGTWISVISLGVILNLGMFMLFLRFNFERSARGVLAATFFYAFLAVYFKAF